MTARRMVGYAVAALVVLIVVASVLQELRWLAVHLSQETGTSNMNSRSYAWWSGFGSVIVPPIIDGIVFAALYYWRHTCHVPTCLRLQEHETVDGYRLCKVHVGQPLRALGLHEIHTDHRAGGGDTK